MRNPNDIFELPQLSKFRNFPISFKHEDHFAADNFLRQQWASCIAQWRETAAYVRGQTFR